MQNYLKLLYLLLLVSVFSCRSSKELIYLKDVEPNDIIKGLPAQTTVPLLRAGDILYISIKSTSPEVNLLYNPESNMEASSYASFQKFTTPSGAYLYGFEIGNDENLNLPMLGKVKAAGYSQVEIEQIIQKKADETLKDAIVKVKLLNFKVTVMGEVKSPGVYYNYSNTINVIEALAMANGNTDFATIRNVMVVRPGLNGNKTYMLDLTSKDIYASEGFYLHPNDNIIVRPDKHKNVQLNSQAYSLILSSASVLIAVLGFVLR
jgi:polysaccharide export outer membrane protein